MKPMLLINFKTYPQGSGTKALELAKVCDRLAGELDADIRIAVQATDIHAIASQISIPVYAQHIDDVKPGSHTGWILAESVKEAGVTGTLLNHSEHRLRTEVLENSVGRAREVGLDIVICANDAVMADSVCSLRPDFVAVEPPELIGGDVSVSSAQPELIEEAVGVTGRHDMQLLVGAGVKTGEDVAKSMELGAAGVLVASGVAKAESPEEAVRELLSHI